MTKRILTLIVIGGIGIAPGVFAQRGGRGGTGTGGDAAAAVKPEEGIPVTDPLVIERCGTCHAKDDKGNLTRISWIRTTPEGWEEAIKRMVRLNGLTLQPAEARSILKYLSTYHGLAPEESKPVMYMAEHRILDEAIPNESVRSTCMNCHALGKVFQWHRTREDWLLLTNMHVAFFPQAEAAFRRSPASPRDPATPASAARGGRGGAAAADASATANGAAASAASGPPPLDQTLDFLAKSYGLHTPEWAAWRARMRPPRLAGRWLVSAHIPGCGQYFGEMTITRGAADDEFTTNVKLQSVNGGPSIARTGSGMVYAGYSWRGRSKGSATVAKPTPDDLSSEMREALWISPDQSTADGRWFWGEYQEFGVDVHLARASSEPVLITLDRPSLKTGSTGQRVRLLGGNFPAQVVPADLDFGSGVTVKSIASDNASEIVAVVDVASNAVAGKRDIAFQRAVLQNAVAIYDKVDYIKVLPEASMARLGGDVHPKGYQQLEAVAFQRGEDGKLHTADDIELGPIEATWSVEEFYAVFGDDDKEFVGTLDSNGLFTPNVDGPNPQRKFGRNNYGDVWIVATTKNEKDKDGKPLVGRSYLVVTVPTYMRWDQPEVGK